jgi:hypothetical protein
LPTGIPIVKLEDKELAKSLGVFAHPSLVIFRQYGKEPIIYAGDLKSQVWNGPNKLECLPLASISSLVKCNTLAYWAHSKVMKKLKCENYLRGLKLDS